MFMGYLQIAAGALTLLLSVMAITQTLVNGDAWWLNPMALVESEEVFGSNPLISAFVVYLAFQMGFGWFLGLLMMGAGVFCLKPSGRRFVTWSSIFNLINFPHGTTVAIMVLHGLGKPEIRDAFPPPKSNS